MSTTLVTGSSLERALECPSSVVLAQANSSSAYSEQGTANHAEDEDSINAGEVPEWVASIVGDAAPTVRSEVAVAYDVAEDTGRIIGYGLKRNYGPLAPFEIPATLDVLAHNDERVFVLDRKLWTSNSAAEENVQVGFGALAAARVYGRSYATVALRYETGRIDRADIDLIDLFELSVRLRDLHGRVAEQQSRHAQGRLVDVRSGRWCRHCPAQHACPEKIALIKRLVTGGEADELELMLPLDDQTAASAYERLQAAKQLLKRIESALYARASERPIPLGGKRFFGRHTKLGNEQLVGTVVRDVVRDSLGPEAVDEVVTYSATKSALKAAIAKRVPKGAGAATERALLATIRERGGASREESTTVGEYEAELALVGGEGSR